MSWVSSVLEKTEGQFVAIDEKTLQRSHDGTSNKIAIHMVSAWVSDNGITLAQVSHPILVKRVYKIVGGDRVKGVLPLDGLEPVSGKILKILSPFGNNFDTVGKIDRVFNPLGVITSGVSKFFARNIRDFRPSVHSAIL